MHIKRTIIFALLWLPLASAASASDQKRLANHVIAAFCNDGSSGDISKELAALARPDVNDLVRQGALKALHVALLSRDDVARFQQQIRRAQRAKTIHLAKSPDFELEWLTIVNVTKLLLEESRKQVGVDGEYSRRLARGALVLTCASESPVSLSSISLILRQEKEIQKLLGLDDRDFTELSALVETAQQKYRQYSDLSYAICERLDVLVDDSSGQESWNRAATEAVDLLNDIYVFSQENGHPYIWYAANFSMYTRLLVEKRCDRAQVKAALQQIERWRAAAIDAETQRLFREALDDPGPAPMSKFIVTVR